MDESKIEEDIHNATTGSSSPTSSRRSIVINTILNQLPLCTQQLMKLKEELTSLPKLSEITPTTQNLNENIKFIQNQMKHRGILEDIEPVEINFVNTESQTQNERAKSDYSNTSKAYSNNEFEDYESNEEDENNCKKSNHVTLSNDKASRSSPVLPPIEIYSSSPSKKDNSRSSRFTSPSKTFKNDNEYYEYEEFYHRDLENARKRQYFSESQRHNDKGNEKCVVHNKIQENQSSSPQTNHYYSKEFIRHSPTTKTKGKYVVNCENCSPSSIIQIEAKGDSSPSNKRGCTCDEDEIGPQQTAFEFYEISSTETTRDLEKIGCCTMITNMFRSIFTPQRS